MSTLIWGIAIAVGVICMFLIGIIIAVELLGPIRDIIDALK